MRISWLTIDDILQRTRGELRGLPMSRVILVSLLIASQSFEVSQSFSRIASTPMWIVPAIISPLLFAGLGFAAAQARDRDDLRTFLARRLRRSWPLLVATVSITLAAIGPLATTRDLTDYVTDTQTLAYLLNLLAFPQFRLPGVFEFNDLRDVVNPILWVAPAYLAAVLVIGISPERHRRQIWIGVSSLCLIALAALSIAGAQLGRGTEALAFAAPMIGGTLCALIGALAQAYSTVLPFDWRLTAAGAAILGVIALLGDWSWRIEPIVCAMLAIPCAYIGIWLSVRRMHGNPLWKQLQPLAAPSMLVAFPIQQLVVALGPRDQNVLVNLVISASPIALAGFVVARVLRHRWLASAREPRVWEVAEGAIVGWRRQPFSLVRLLRALGMFLLIGSIVVIATMLLFALTFFALQRDAGGV